MNLHWLVPANHPQLADGEAHVWAVPLERDTIQIDSLSEILSPDEQRRAADFRLAAPRQCFVIARVALRGLLGRYLDASPADVAISVGFHNKPRLADIHRAANLQFNVAHSEGLALIALTRGRSIGIDIERLRHVRHAEHIAARYFHPDEINAIASAAPATRDAAFLRCWTGKEAVLKAIGTGITASLAEIRVPNSDDFEVDVTMKALSDSPLQTATCWVRRIIPGDNYLAAVAVAGSPINLRCMTFSASWGVFGPE